VLAAALLLPEIRSQRSITLDVPGVLLASGALFSLIFALVESQRYDWGPINAFGSFSLGSTHWSMLSVYSLLVYAGLLLLLFVGWETRAAQPLLPLSLFRDRNFSVANLAFSIVGFPFAMFIVLSIFLQSIQGMNAVHAGLAMVPASLGIMLAGPIAGRLSDRFNGKYTLIAGLLVAAVGIVLTASSLGLSNTTWSLIFPLAVTGVGMGFIFAPLTTLAMRDIQPAMAGAASGFLFTNRQVGQALGSAVVGSFLANRVASGLPGQAARLASQAPASMRAHFVITFDHASHQPQNFGASPAHAALASDAPQTVAQQMTVLSHEVLGQAFVNAARPSIALCAGVLLLTAVFAGSLHGGRSAAAASLADVSEDEEAA
jgi:MFS family permease